jgi:hypothetical protein
MADSKEPWKRDEEEEEEELDDTVSSSNFVQLACLTCR